MVFKYLLQDNLHLKHIGELYVHLFGMKYLSLGERDTVKEVLKEHDEFIAGVILRNHHWDFTAFPVYFSRSQPDGIAMDAVFEGQASRNRWPRSARFRRR